MPSKSQITQNRDQIFGALDNGAKTRSDLATETGIARTTIYDYLVRALGDGEVRKYSVPLKTRGRPRVFWEKLDTLEVASTLDGVAQPDLSKVEG